MTATQTRTGDGPGGDDPSALVGAAVRARRTAAGLSAAELARRSGVSGPFVSQLEGDRCSVSIPVLYRLAAALGCAANDLLPLTGDVRRAVRAGEGIRLSASEEAPALGAGAPGGGGPVQRSRLLSRTGPGVLLEAHHYVVRPGDAEQGWFAQPGEVFVHVLAGSISVEFADGTSTDLDAGDSLHHEGDVPHRWVLRGQEPAEALAVVTASSGR